MRGVAGEGGRGSVGLRGGRFFRVFLDLDRLGGGKRAGAIWANSGARRGSPSRWGGIGASGK